MHVVGLAAPSRLRPDNFSDFVHLRRGRGGLSAFGLPAPHLGLPVNHLCYAWEPYNTLNEDRLLDAAVSSMRGGVDFCAVHSTPKTVPLG